MSSDDEISPPDVYQLEQQSSAVDVSPAFEALDELQESGEVTAFKIARLRAKYSEVRNKSRGHIMCPWNVTLKCDLEI